MIDISQITSTLGTFWWVFPIVILFLFLKTPRAKGLMGEGVVKVKAMLFLPSNNYARFNNVTLPAPDGSTQIDHVFVSRFGIFCVETKAMQGWIFGTEHQPQWTQKIYKKTYKFQNPLRQNYKHVKALEAVLSVPSTKVHSVIVFVGDVTFKTEMPDNVTYAGNFVSYVKTFKTPVFSAPEVQELCDRIESQRFQPSLQTHRAHVQNVKKRADPSAPRLCPKCGEPMILRTSKKGPNRGKSFWGCSSFPKCRIVHNLH